jgi:peptidyl-prolyl cis-trans isomerase D
MLEMFRKHAQGWAAKGLLTLLVLGVGVWGITDVFSGISVSVARWTGFGPQDLAKVGDVVISSESFRKNLTDELRRMSKKTGGTLSVEDARKLGIDQQVFDQIINGTVVDATADKLNVTVGEKQVVDTVAANPAFQNAQGKFDPAQFRMILQQNGIDEQVFVAEQQRGLRQQYMMSVATGGQVAPAALTEAVMRYRNETRDGRYFVVQVSEKDVPPPSDDELKKQYEARPAAYTAPEYRSIAVMKVEPADVAARLTVTPEELQAGYDKNKADYYTPERRTVLQISFPNLDAAKAAKSKLDAGGDFVKLAAETGAKEADITFADRVKSDFLDPKIGDAAFALSEGQVSDPVVGALNTVLLKATKVSAAHQQSLEEATPTLTKRLQLEKARDEIQSIYDAVEDARAQETKFEDIAAKAGIPFTLAPAVSLAGQDKDGKDVSLPAKADVLKAAFESDVGLDTDAISMDEGYVWYQVREVIPSALKPLETVKSQVTADYVGKKLRTLAADKAKDIIAKAGSQNLDALAAANGGAAIKQVSAIKRSDVSEEFDGPAALALFAAPQGALTWSLLGDGKAARIIEVTKVTSRTIDPKSADFKATADDLKASLAADSTATFVKSLRSVTDVSINEDLWKTIRGGQAQ